VAVLPEVSDAVLERLSVSLVCDCVPTRLDGAHEESDDSVGAEDGSL
jgi:hypothetical protein